MEVEIGLGDGVWARLRSLYVCNSASEKSQAWAAGFLAWRGFFQAFLLQFAEFGDIGFTLIAEAAFL